jgi:hypothetical protein
MLKISDKLYWVIYWSRVLCSGGLFVMEVVVHGVTACWVAIVISVIVRVRVEGGQIRVDRVVLFFIAAAVAWAIGVGMKRLGQRIRPTAQPGWIRNGLWDGRYAALVPWSNREAGAMKIVAISWVISELLLVGSCIGLMVWDAKSGGKNPWPHRILGGAYIVNCCIGAALLILKTWQVVHLRLRPFQEPRFAPIMPPQTPTGSKASKIGGARTEARYDVPAGGDAVGESIGRRESIP